MKSAVGKNRMHLSLLLALAVACFARSSTLKMEALHSFENFMKF
jgi:hypothetical protein